MIEPKFIDVLVKAVAGPEAYGQPPQLYELQAAFDATWAQACKGLFGSRPRNRLEARLQLNRALVDPDKMPLVQALRNALAAAEGTLDTPDYAEGDDMAEFIRKELAELVRVIPGP
jgi:hypothetical protein